MLAASTSNSGCLLPLIAAAGSRHPPSFASLPFLCAGGAKPKTHILQDSADGFAAFLLVTLLPVSVYAATHLSVLFQWVHLWSLLLLATGPLLFVTSLKGAVVDGLGGRGGRNWRGLQVLRVGRR